MSTVYLALGSNLGDRLECLREAVRRLGEGGAAVVRKTSSVYETVPVGLTAQPDFLNIVVEVETALGPRELLARCLRIESELGRIRHERWGPRTIDIDVLCYDALAINEEGLELPHPRMKERGFVMAPLAEIAPALVLGDETAEALAMRVGARGLRRVGPLFVGADA